ncbi:hypothetical protein H1R20_g12438, partial [Candolleomyces eurysporus]
MESHTLLTHKTAKKRKLPSTWDENDTVAPTPSKVARQATLPSPLALFSTPLTFWNPILPLPHASSTTPRPPLSEKKNRLTFSNGFITKPQTPSHTPYALKQHGKHQKNPLTLAPTPFLLSLEPLGTEEWNALARSIGILMPNKALRDFQVQAANCIIQRQGYLCIIAPTGSGKSLVWVLGLVAQKGGISLVIVPYTSLGLQGEQRSYGAPAISSHFIYSENKAPELLEKVAKGQGMQIVYICPEMLESPAIACILHSLPFKSQLSGIFLDESHTVQESKTWRPAYSNLHLL